MEYDVFVSHASEDKESFVRSLAAALSEFGVSVWYDEFALKVGDSLSRSIDRGLSRARFGVVVLSPAFLSKPWPEYELRGLVAKELEQGKVILPVWLGVSKSDILKFSPPLADKKAIVMGDRKIVEVAAAVIEVVRPDLFQRIRRRVAFLNAPTKQMRVETKTIKMGQIRHDKLSTELEGRIRLVRAALFKVHPHSMDNWVDSFRADSHPSNEVRIWEHIASCFLEVQRLLSLNDEEQAHTFTLLLGLSVGDSVETVLSDSGPMKREARIAMLRCWASDRPAYDLLDDPFDVEYVTDGDSERMLKSDREHFPIDLPEKLIDELAEEWKSSP